MQSADNTPPGEAPETTPARIVLDIPILPEAPRSPEPDPTVRATAYVVTVQTAGTGKIADYYWNNVELKVGDLCVVDIKGELDFGAVAVSRHVSPRCAEGCGKKRPAGRVKRKATPDDIARSKDLRAAEKGAMGFCRRKILDMDLAMSLSRVSYSFDGTKALFSFTAETRVDFRDLVKELADYTRLKVEMRQIGVRDEARIIGGCGPCGAELCCSAFLNDFMPVSIRMAKDQNLSLNPAKISGVCGRLMCCLSYEHANYKELVARAPKMGKAIKDPHGEVAKVIQLNLLKERVVVVYEDGSKGDYGIEEVVRVPGGMVKAKEMVAQEKADKAAKEAEERKASLVRAALDRGATPEDAEREATELMTAPPVRVREDRRPPREDRRPQREDRRPQREDNRAKPEEKRDEKRSESTDQAQQEKRRRNRRRGKRGGGEGEGQTNRPAGSGQGQSQGDRNRPAGGGQGPSQGDRNRPAGGGQGQSQGDRNRPVGGNAGAGGAADGEGAARRSRRRRIKRKGPPGEGGGTA
jgi:cell fate regulator YaaT (PSP1 superfamily)